MRIAALRHYLTAHARFNPNLIYIIVTTSTLMALTLGGLAFPAAAQVTSTPVGATGASVTSTNVATTTSDADPPYLGVISNATASGAVVSSVVPGSPAAQAGIQAGDVIQAVNGTQVTLAQPLSAFLKSLAPGTQIQMAVVRNGTTLTVQVTLSVRPTSTAAPPGATPASSTPPAALGTGNKAFLGVGLVDTGNGIQIARVADGSAAAQAGLLVGDVVLAIDNQQIQAVSQAQAVLAAKAPGQPVAVTVQRGSQTLTISAVMGTPPGAAPATLVSTPAPGQITPQSDVLAQTPRVRLGVTYDVVTTSLASARGLSVTNGALIVTVDPGSPADVAGVKVGDVVTAVDGDKVDTKHTLAVRMVAYNAGDTLTLTVARGAQTLQLPVTLVVSGSA